MMMSHCHPRTLHVMPLARAVQGLYVQGVFQCPSGSSRVPFVIVACACHGRRPSKMPTHVTGCAHVGDCDSMHTCHLSESIILLLPAVCDVDTSCCLS
jgi:hypothetical protein